MNIYFTADTHYNHQNIVRGCSEWEDKTGCRPFRTLKAHNEAVIKNINKIVKSDDILYHVGDVAFGGKDSIWDFRKQINCQTIHLCLGNHDHHIKKNTIISTEKGLINVKTLFTTVQDRIEKVIQDKYDFIMDHYPIRSYHKMDKGAIHVYGHTHKELNYWKNAVCVCIECHPEFRPFSLQEILNIVKDRQKLNWS